MHWIMLMKPRNTTFCHFHWIVFWCYQWKLIRLAKLRINWFVVFRHNLVETWANSASLFGRITHQQALSLMIVTLFGSLEGIYKMVSSHWIRNIYNIWIFQINNNSLTINKNQFNWLRVIYVKWDLTALN